MKKTALSVLVVLACVAFGFGQDVQIKDQTPFVYAYLECTGSYSQISAKIGEFLGDYFSQGLGPFTGVMALYLNGPGEVPEAELKWRIGMPIAADASPAAPLQKGEFSYPKVASYLYVGPYEKVGEAYTKVMTYLDQNGWKLAGPAMETYLNNPMSVPPEKLETEIILPVEKK
jgi:effector-binding domain-containing protein